MLLKIFFRISIILLLFPLTFVQNFHAQTNSETLKLELNKPIERKIASDQQHQFEIFLNENQYAKIVVEQTETNIKARIFDAGGTYLTKYEDELRLKEAEIIEFTTTNAGNYRIEVNAAFKKSSGLYKIRLAETRTATERDKSLFEAHTLLQKADELRTVSKYSEALPLAVRALEIAEKESGTENAFVGLILDQLGGIQRELGNYSEALKLIRRSIAVNEKLLGAEHPQTVAAYTTLGIYYRRTNDSPKAERIFRQALESYERIFGKEHPQIASILNTLAVWRNDLNDDEEAEKLYLRALQIAEQNLGENHILTGNILNNLGVFYLLEKKDYDQAEKFLLRALKIQAEIAGTDNPEYSNRLQNLGIIYRNRKQYAKALDFYERALVIREKALGKEHQNIGFLLNNISNIYKATGDYEKALEIQKRVRAIAEKVVGNYHPLAIISIGNTVTIYAAKGDLANAIETQKIYEERFEKVIATDLTIGSERQKLAYSEYFPSRTSRVISLHLKPSKNQQTAVDLAAQAVLRRKGRVLDSVAENMTALRERADAGDRELLDRLKEITTRLGKLTLNKPAKISDNEYKKQIADLESQKEVIEREINNRVAGFAVQTPTVTLETVRQEIPEDAALLEFAVFRPFDPKAENNDEADGKPHLMVYVIRRSGEIQWKDLGETKSIDAAIEDWRKALRDPKRAGEKKLARTVDEKIMKPVRTLLGGSKKLLISPDGDLNLIPFEALVDEKGNYLIENYSFSYLSSGRDLLRLKTPRSSRSESLIIANPLFGSASATSTESVTATRNLSDTYFAPLVGTENEARSIQTLFPEAQLLIGTRADEATLKNTNAPRILHIATHGFFLEDGLQSEKIENPLLRSGIALSGANKRDGGTKEDGILTALEASGLNLWGTKLVVLSACDTGLGEVKNGEGVYGLRRAFTLAGTETLMMSLWSVSDYTTKELMTNYYKNLKSGMGRGASLRQVQLEILKKPNRQHPFYWAAFIQSGEWANLEGKR